jgi:electron transfer flavoprotein alpha subunit
MSGLLAVVVVRDGAMPAGADETVAECGGRALLCLVDSSPDDRAQLTAASLADELPGVTAVWLVHTHAYAPGALAAGIAGLLAGENAAITTTSETFGSPTIVLPASPDGRDLAPRLAHTLNRPLFAGAVRVSVAPPAAGAATLTVDVARGGGRQIETVVVNESAVATLVPGVRGVQPAATVPAVPTVTDLGMLPAAHGAGADATVIETLPPDVATMDLAEAQRILCGGAGLDDAARFVQLEQVATAIGASVGATRVITDRGWIGHERQIGTTGAVVDPALYLAFGISGAVQHTSGLGQPDHIVSVNIDPHCPMMQLADLAIVADANAVLDELSALITELSS